MNMLGTNIKITKRIHSAWRETKGLGMKNYIGKYQYIFTSKKGEISLVSFPNYFMDGKDIWEIYCTKGNLFDDVERFDKTSDIIPTEVKRRIFDLLEPGIFDCLKENVKELIDKLLGVKK